MPLKASTEAWPVQVRLYLPKEWTDAPDRCALAGVPAEVGFQTKPEIALDILDEAEGMQVPYKVRACQEINWTKRGNVCTFDM